MIRSLSYASYAGLDQYITANPESASLESLNAWASFWQTAASIEFLRSYRKTAAANHALLPPGEQAQVLFSAYLLEKALYELLYELNNRPTWLRIPLSGILTL
jgi:maltose alpha-D-glucosyltransferase/alpha-amylase